MGLRERINALRGRAPEGQSEEEAYERRNAKAELQEWRRERKEEGEADRPRFRQDLKQTRSLAKSADVDRANKEEAEAATRHQYEQTHPESYGAAATTRSAGGVKDYVRRLQMPSNLRKKETEERERRANELISTPAVTPEDRQQKADAIRQKRTAAATQAERDRLDNIATAQAANQRFQGSLDAQRAAENRRDFRRSKQNPTQEPSWMDSLRSRLAANDADAKRQARQAAGQRAAIHKPSIAERIKQRTAGLDLGDMLGTAVGVARGEGAGPLPTKADLARKAKGVPAKTRALSSGFDTRIEAFVAEAKPKAKARLKEIPGTFRANLKETLTDIGAGYAKSQQPRGKSKKPVASLAGSSLDSMLGMGPTRAKYRGRGRSGGIGSMGGGIGDIGGMFGGGGGGDIGDITGMFGGGGGGGGGGGRNYNSGSRNVYRPGARLTCNSCGHSWTMRGTRRPRVCPNCKSYVWNKSGGSSQSSQQPSSTDFLDPFG